MSQGSGLAYINGSMVRAGKSNLSGNAGLHKEHKQATDTSTEIPLIRRPYKFLFTVNEEPSREIEISV